MKADLYDGSALKPNIRAGLEAFARDLLRFNRAANLISRRDPESEVRLLLGECVQVGLWLDARVLPAGPWADLGSGGGFPGLILALLHPQRDMALVERRRGRCDFLRREKAALGLERTDVLEVDAAALAGREGWQRSRALVSLKAVAPAEEALALAEPLVAAEGRVLLFQRPGWRPPEGSGWIIGDRWRGEDELVGQGAFLLERRSV